jgi:hypothetical protein
MAAFHTKVSTNLCRGNRAEHNLCRWSPGMNSVSVMVNLLVSQLPGLVPCKCLSSAPGLSAFHRSRHRLAHAVASLGFRPWAAVPVRTLTLRSSGLPSAAAELQR